MRRVLTSAELGAAVLAGDLVAIARPAVEVFIEVSDGDTITLHRAWIGDGHAALGSTTTDGRYEVVDVAPEDVAGRVARALRRHRSWRVTTRWLAADGTAQAAVMTVDPAIADDGSGPGEVWERFASLFPR